MHATCFVEDGTKIFTWRDALAEKYSSLPGVRKLHDFFFICPSPGEAVVMKVREHCFDPQVELSVSPLHVVGNAQLSTLLTYKQARRHPISDDKMAHMVQMYNSFVPLDRRPEFLPAFISNASAPMVSAITTARATASRAASPRKKSQCSLPGCDGAGHKNPKRWNEGHNTKAGCPRRGYN